MVYVITLVSGDLTQGINCRLIGVYENKSKAYHEAEKAYIFCVADLDPDDDRQRKWFPCKHSSHCYHWKYCDSCDSNECNCFERWSCLRMPKTYIDYNVDKPRRSGECPNAENQTCRIEWDNNKCVRVDCATNELIPDVDVCIYIEYCDTNTNIIGFC